MSLIISIFGSAPVLVALVVCVGLITQKASVDKVISGSLKALIGMLILNAGADVIVDMLEPLGEIIAEAFGFQGVIPVNEAITALAMTKLGSQMALVIVGSFIVNLVLARITPLRYIFLSGHHILFMAAVVTAMFYTLGLSEVEIIIYGSLIAGIIMTVMPAFSMPFMQKATKGAGFAMGHLGTSGYILSGIVGKYLGGNPDETDSEKMVGLQKLGIFRESVLMMGIGMAIIYLIGVIVVGPEFMKKICGKENPYVFAVIQGFVFAAGVSIILLGVRMFIGEIIPAFRGISEKIVPNAVPALDCPAIFPYAPNAVLIGFFGYTIGQIITMIVMIMSNFPVVIFPVILDSFFLGGTAAVFGNATGGRRGAFLGSMAEGLVISWLQGILYIMMGSLGFQGTTFADMDFVITGIIIGSLGHSIPLVLFIFIGLVVLAIWYEMKITRHLMSGD